MPKIFISYRRDDSEDIAGRIYDRLVAHFGKAAVFKDVDAIPFGVDVRDYINASLDQCQVVLAVIGKTWLTVTDGNGDRRLDNPADWVRLELEEAFKRKGKVVIVPVLVRRATMPAPNELPPALVNLAYLNAASARPDPDFHGDMDRLVAQLERYFKTLNPTFEFEVVTVNALGQVIEKAIKTAEYCTEDLGNGVALDLVRIPAGQFWMGSPENEAGRYDDEEPQHQVAVPEFWMGKYPVTQTQYQALMGKNPSYFSERGANRPVEQVSWYDAVAFCEKFSQQTGRAYRLPSEAEWEYACRAGTTTPFYFGPTITTDLANYNGNYTYGNGPTGAYRKQTTDVGSFAPNAFGLYDMHGNVWEWCADHRYDSYAGAPADGSAWLSSDDAAERVLRGGSWDFNPVVCRSAGRYGFAPGSIDDYVGFRVVCGGSRN